MVAATGTATLKSNERNAWEVEAKYIIMKATAVAVLVVFFMRSLVYAQSDPDEPVSYSQEDSKMTSKELQRFYRYITRAAVQEKTLLKVGIWPASDRGEQSERRKLRLGFNAELVVEQKLSPSFSFLAGFDLYWRYATYHRYHNFSSTTPPAQSFSPDQENTFQINWKAGFRYYYAMSKRIKNGKSANNFSANYLTAQIAEPIRKYNRYILYSPLLNQQENHKWTDNLLDSPSPRLLIAYGLQRRLGRLAYIDVNAGPEIQFSEYHLGASISFQLNALMGLGW